MQKKSFTLRVPKWAKIALFIVAIAGSGYAIGVNSRVNSDDRTESNTTNVVANDSSTVNNSKQGDISGGSAVQGNVNGDVIGGDKIEYHPTPKEPIKKQDPKEDARTEYKFEHPVFNGPVQNGDNNTMNYNVTNPLPRNLNEDDKRRLNQIEEESLVTIYFETGKETEEYLEEICQYLDLKKCTYEFRGSQQLAIINLRSSEINERFEIGKSDTKHYVIELKKQ